LHKLGSTTKTIGLQFPQEFPFFFSVIPAKVYPRISGDEDGEVGIHTWTPAYAGVTVEEERAGDGGRGKSGGDDGKVASGTGTYLQKYLDPCLPQE